jgi:hypothetical protein
LILLAGLGGLILGSECMVHGAVNIANTFGISQAVIGLTIVSIGTSLPELATCVVAAIRKEADIIIGNLIGSNVFNIGAILGCTSIISPLPNDGITALDLTIMVFLSIILLPIMLTGFRICRQGRRSPDIVLRPLYRLSHLQVPPPVRAVVQRARRASLRIDGSPAGTMEDGLVVLVGIVDEDSKEDVEWLTRKNCESPPL